MNPLWQRLRGGARLAAIGLAVSAWAMLNTPWNRVLDMPNRDAMSHAGLVASAAEALREGQVVAREVPRCMLHVPPVFDRYALFQFYSFLPYEAGGLVALAGISPYHALVGIVFFGYFLGFLGCFRLGRRLGISVGGAVAAAVIFTLAPYHLHDWGQRGAFPELAAFALLPWVLETSLGASRRPGLGAWLGCSLAWCALMLTHNIFHAWSAALFFLLVLMERLKEKGTAIWRPLSAYLFAAALSAFFLAPVARLGPSFSVLEIQPFQMRSLTGIGHLLNLPWLFPWFGYAGGADDYFQIGWPILAGACLHVFRARKDALKNPFLWAFALAVFLAWSPLDFWGFLGPLKLVQFPYRLLAYATLFGAVLAGQACASLEFADKPVFTFGLFAACAILALPYQALMIPGPFSPEALADAHKEMGLALFSEANAYVVGDENARKLEPPLPLEGLEKQGRCRELGEGVEACFSGQPPKLAGMKTGLWTQLRFEGAGPRTVVLLPAPWYPDLYRVEVDGKAAGYGRVGNRLAMKLPEGGSVIRYRFAGWGWANALSLAAWAAWLGLLAWLVVSPRAKKAGPARALGVPSNIPKRPTKK